MADITELKVYLEVRDDDEDDTPKKGKKKSDVQRLDGIPGMDAQQMLNHYSMMYPELATATIGEPIFSDTEIIYPVTSTLGTKG